MRDRLRTGDIERIVNRLAVQINPVGHKNFDIGLLWRTMIFQTLHVRHRLVRFLTHLFLALLIIQYLRPRAALPELRYNISFSKIPAAGNLSA